jgi:hypothetical protein
MSTTNLKDRLNGKLQSQQPTIESGVSTMPNPATALTPIESNYVALTNNALDIIRKNLKNQPLSYALFDVIKSPSGGATIFTLPTISGDEVKKEITGIILNYDTPRAYWQTPEPVEGTFPNCYSRDSLVSYEGKPCNSCPFNELGSKTGDTLAKACKEQVAIYLLRPDNIMPIIVRVPVTSKIIFQKYMIRLIGSMIPVYGVVTKITLEKATSKAGQPYALYNFEAVSTLSPEETANAKAFGQKFMEIINAAIIEPASKEVS